MSSPAQVPICLLNRLDMLVACVAILLSGCWSNKPTEKAHTKEMSTNSTDLKPHESVPNQLEQPKIVSNADNGTPENVEESDRDSSVEPDPEKGSAGIQSAASDQREIPLPPPDPERILILAEGGPVVLDIAIYIDGATHTSAAEALIDDVLRLADSDGDGDTTWRELTSRSYFSRGQFGNPTFASEEQRNTLTTSYDINQNKHVDRTEVLGFLRQDATQSRPFRLVDNVIDQSENPTGLFHWLDVNGDDILSNVEIESLTRRLWLNDMQDDGVLVASDFRSEVNLPRLNRRRNAGPRRAIHLLEFSKPSHILAELEQRYSFGNPLSQPDWLDTPELFVALDEDQDGFLLPQEFSKISEVSADVLLGISFGKANVRFQFELDRSRTRVNVMSASPLGIKFSANGTQIEIGVRGSRGYEQTVTESDELFKKADANDDKMLTIEEFSELGTELNLPFEAIDSDGDKLVTKCELTRTLKNRTAAIVDRITANVLNQGDPTFAFIDQDDNGQLTHREVSACVAALKKLDHGADGHLSLSEFPSSVGLQINRGDGMVELALNDAEIRIPVIRSWFDGMDANRDGEITRKEFLGSPTDFTRLDTNRNEHIEASEAAMAE